MMPLPTDATATPAYPYLPAGTQFYFVTADDRYMRAARATAQDASLDRTMPTGSVVVIDGEIIGRGANGSLHHEQYGCERVRLHVPTGQCYELCEGCHPKNHSELRAVADAQRQQNSMQLTGSSLYLWGHWWCCRACWTVMQRAGISCVYLLDTSAKLFNKDHPDNIVGRQFA